MRRCTPAGTLDFRLGSLLILDEPCQGLDAAHRDSFVRAVDALIRARAVTVIYVTHRPDEIPPSITRVLRLP